METIFEQSIYEATVPINQPIGSTVLDVSLYFDFVSTEESPLNLYVSIYSPSYLNQGQGLLGFETDNDVITTSTDCQGKTISKYSVQLIMESSPLAAKTYTYVINVNAYNEENSDYFGDHAIIYLQVVDPSPSPSLPLDPSPLS